MAVTRYFNQFARVMSKKYSNYWCYENFEEKNLPEQHGYVWYNNADIV